MSKWVMVECISQYRMRYMVEAPDDHPEWALDTVTCEDAKEFSQLWLGETIVSHRVVSEEEALKICDEDNDYLKSWTAEQKKNSMFTSMEEQGYEPTEFTLEFPDGTTETVDSYSPYYYDTDRNR